MRRRTTDRFARFRFASAALLAGAIALGSLAIACGSEKPTSQEASPAPAEPAQGAPATGEAAPPSAGAPADQGAPSDAIASEGIPEGYPKDVPIYPGATPGGSMAMPGMGVFATFTSDDTVDAILTRYREELAKNGWTVQDTTDKGSIEGTKGKRSVQVRARITESGRSEIAVSTSEG
jgi:hypothetical protein